MDWRGWAEIVFTIALTVAVGWPLGIYMARVWALPGMQAWLAASKKEVEEKIV